MTQQQAEHGLTALPLVAVGLRAWLTADITTSPRQASLQRLYYGWRRLRGNPTAMFALVVLAALVAVALLAPVIAPEGYDQQNLAGRLLPPSLAHPFGTDDSNSKWLLTVVGSAVPGDVIQALDGASGHPCCWRALGLRVVP